MTDELKVADAALLGAALLAAAYVWLRGPYTLDLWPED